jgi:serine/threonine-protein kinase
MNYIGKYKICGLLGRGGMSKVYKVEIPVIEKIVALKLLDPDPLLVDLIGMKKIRELFISEAAKLASLRHPNIVEIWNFDHFDGKHFYLMDYYFNNLGIMIGETRWTEQPSRLIKLEKAIDWTRQILTGLACLHHAGIIHQDIKPFNLLLTEQEVVKICDFGLSKLRGETISTPSNLKVGSAWYASPEQEDDPERVDFRADLFSTGITLYRMLTGQIPAGSPDAPSRYNPDLDADWDKFMMQSIDPDPEKRFSSAKDMLAQLEVLEKKWQEKMQLACRVTQLDEHNFKPANSRLLELRKDSVKIASRNARNFFSLDDLWRPLNYISNNFQANPDSSLTDLTTGLTWQQAGSEYPVTWQQAKSFIRALNQQHYAGRTNWRLPTVNELISLLTEAPHAEHLCIEPVFDARQTAFWSSDRKSYTAAWYVSVDLGFVHWQDFSACYYVKAVSDTC